jgi:5-methylcytosine-specific restriction protein A
MPWAAKSHRPEAGRSTSQHKPKVIWTGKKFDHNFYGRSEWIELRRKMLRFNKVCVECRIKRATHVDHIIRRSKRPDLSLSPTNLQCLCHSCHSRKTAKECQEDPVSQPE